VGDKISIRFLTIRTRFASLYTRGRVTLRSAVR